jgi:hypothetical protein
MPVTQINSPTKFQAAVHNPLDSGKSLKVKKKGFDGRVKLRLYK